MQPDENSQNPSVYDDSEEIYNQNHRTLLSVLSGGHRRDTRVSDSGDVAVRLERLLVDHRDDTFVRFEGDAGIEALLKRLHDYLSAFEEERHEGHVTALTGSLVSPRGIVVPTRVTLGAGGQIAYEVGPSQHLIELLQAIEHLDRQIHVASRSMGCDYELLAEGYNPYVEVPLDVPLVPRTRWTLLNAYLSQTGRYARDMMRCSCSTQVSFDYGRGRGGTDMYRLAVALSPLLTFLTDNVRSFRGSGARLCPRMARSIIWEEVDPQRCGIVPGTFDHGFSVHRYLEWVESLRPILFTDSLGTTTSMSKRTTHDLMGDRVLSGAEALGLFTTVYPSVRLGRRLEFLQADSLRPRLALGYVCLLKGIFCNALAFDGAHDLIGQICDDDVVDAMHELRVRGWDALVYGRPVPELVAELVEIARSGLSDATELSLLNEIAVLWDFGMVPRDAFVHQEEKAERGW